MLKLLNIFILAFLYSCSEGPLPAVNNLELKEALLRTRNVYTVDKNVDFNNPVKLNFYQEYAEQLIEVNFSTSSMNNYPVSVVNSDVSSNKSSGIQTGNLVIEFDGQDITACVLQECNETKCLGTSETATSFSGELATESLYLNLTKMSQSQASHCSPLNFSQANKFHSLTFRETVSGSGGRLRAQVIVYNRTNRPSDIQNVFNE